MSPEFFPKLKSNTAMFRRIADMYLGCTAIVVGAGGIGREIVRLLAPFAGRLVIADKDELLLTRVMQDVSHDGGPLALHASKILTRVLDVTDSAGVAEFARYISSDVGSPQFAFYTAGILTIEPLMEMTPDNWNRAIAVNLSGAFYCTHALAKLMIEKKRGSILILGSIAGTKARSGSRVNPVYNVSKAGIAAFVNAAAMQFRSHGIRINSISPGPVSTPMMDVQPPNVHTAIRDIMLDGRMNEPREVAELALFVAAHGRFTGEDVGLGGGAGLGG